MLSSSCSGKLVHHICLPTNNVRLVLVVYHKPTSIVLSGFMLILADSTAAFSQLVTGHG
jgi:hypothetical protein